MALSSALASLIGEYELHKQCELDEILIKLPLIFLSLVLVCYMAQECEPNELPAGDNSIAAARRPGPRSPSGGNEGLSPGQLIEVW